MYTRAVNKFLPNFPYKFFLGCWWFMSQLVMKSVFYVIYGLWKIAVFHLWRTKKGLHQGFWKIHLKISMSVCLAFTNLMVHTVLRFFFHNILGLWKSTVFPLKFQKLYILLSPFLFTVYTLDTVNSFENFELNSIFGLRKNRKNNNSNKFIISYKCA